MFAPIFRSMSLMVLLSGVIATSGAAQGVTLGLETGLRRSTISVSPLEAEEQVRTRSDFQGGLFLNIPVSRALSTRVGARIARRGADERTVLFDTPLDLSLRLDYLEIPVLAQFRLAGTARKQSLYALVGPVVAFQVGCGVTLRVLGETTPATCSHDENTGDYLAFDTTSPELGGLLGLGVDFPLGGMTGMVELTYNHGLGDIDSDPTYNIKHRAFSLSFGLVFGR